MRSCPMTWQVGEHGAQALGPLGSLVPGARTADDTVGHTGHAPTMAGVRGTAVLSIVHQSPSTLSLHCAMDASGDHDVIPQPKPCPPGRPHPPGSALPPATFCSWGPYLYTPYQQSPCPGLCTGSPIPTPTGQSEGRWTGALRSSQDGKWQREKEVNWPRELPESRPSPRPGSAGQQGSAGGQTVDLSLLREGLGLPVSACALPWANNDRNAC